MSNVIQGPWAAAKPAPYIKAYEVFNRITGRTKTYASAAAATRAMDAADNAYGAYITTRRAIWSDGQ